MSQKHKDLTEPKQEIEGNGTIWSAELSVSLNPSYAELTSASPPMGIFLNRSEPNVGFWN